MAPNAQRDPDAPRSPTVRMPAVLLSTLVLALAGCASDEPTTVDASAPPGSSAALTFTATDEVAWTSAMKSTAPGPTELTIECGEAVEHGLAIEGVQDGGELVACAGGGTDATTVELEAGEYTFFCTIPGHRDAGMEGTLAVG